MGLRSARQEGGLSPKRREKPMYTARSVLSLTSPRLPHRPGVEVVGYWVWDLWVGFAFPLGFLLFSLSHPSTRTREREGASHGGRVHWPRDWDR